MLWTNRVARALALGLIIATETVAAQPGPFVVPRAQGAIILDGIVDEPAWEAISPLPLVVQSPNFGEAPSERTEIRVAYDEQYLYLSGRQFAAPENVFATSFKRDLWTTSTDWFGVCLDTFNDNENALCFYTTPTGLRLDYTLSNDAQGSNAADPSWNTFWDVAVTRTDEGWFAEIRIPFSSLRFQKDRGQVIMGMIVTRYISRKNEWIVYPSVPPRWGFWSFAKPSQSQRVVFQDVTSRTPLYVAPYVLGGLGQDHRLNALETGYRRVDDPAADLGLDLKYGLTNNLTMDVTVNTDFAQVEADDQQINLTRFSLFFPEKRQFFLERSSIFDFNVGAEDRLFYSRRIGLVDGASIPVIGGLRLVGRVRGWDVGLLDMQTARVTSGRFDAGGVPSENFGVVRLRRRVVNAYSYAGGIVTSRVDEEGGYNVSYGLDGIVRVGGNDYVSVTAAQTLRHDAPSDASILDGARLHAQWERRTQDGLGLDLSATRSGRAFDPGIGFQLRRDYTRFGNRVSYGWRPGERSPFQRQLIGLTGSAHVRNGDHVTETLRLAPWWSALTKAGASMEVGTELVREDLLEGFALGNAVVNAGAYTFYQGYGYYETAPGQLLRFHVSATAGSFFDGNIAGASIEPSWTASRYFELSAYYELSRIRFPSRGQEYDAHVVRGRMQVTLNTSLSATAFLQYGNLNDAIVANARLRYNPREGVDVYLVYNEGYLTNRYRHDPVLPPFSSRTLLLKYVYTLAL